MATTTFLMLNGLGVIFLLYVLVNFLKEGRRPVKNDRIYAPEFRQRNWADVIVMTHPISHSAQGGLSVIPLRTADHYNGKLAHGTTPRGTFEAFARRISTR